MRNVLEEVFTVVESVSDDVGDLFEDIVEEAEGARDRIRRRQDTQWRRAARAAAQRASDRIDPVDLEHELRRDEQAEARAERRGAGPEAADPSEAGDSAATEGAGARPSLSEAFPEILGWQPLVLNHATECARCGCGLTAGQSGFMGLGERGLTRTTLCPGCAGSA